MANYPSELPLQHIKNVIKIVASGEIASEKATFAHSLWVIQGFAQNMVLGDPQVVLLSYTPTLTDDQAISILTNATSETGAQVEIPWAAILIWVIQWLLSMYQAPQSE